MARAYRTLPQLTPQQIEKFWSRVDKTPGQGPQGECWEYQGHRQKESTGHLNYGYFNIYFTRKNQRNALAHRVAYFIQFGFDPYGLVVRHSCDNPPCCRGEHLTAGTDAENVQDAVRRGRHVMPTIRPHGESHFKAKLTEQMALEIIKACHNEKSDLKLSKMFPVSRALIWGIRHYRYWKHLSRS